MKNTVSGNEARGFQKLIVDADTDTVLGIHMIGPDSAEIMQVNSTPPPLSSQKQRSLQKKAVQRWWV